MSDRRIDANAAITALLVIAAFVLGHAYGGIHHDGLLYVGEALVGLDPARMGDDLFFLFGSQGAFSIVPAFYTRAIAWFGIGDAARGMLALSLSADLLATWWLLRAMSSGRVLAWSMVLLFTVSPSYGGHRVFGYGETFFTARGLAEAVVLFGLGWLVRGRASIAIACMVCAAGVHPLMALPGLLVVWCWLMGSDRRWAWAALLAVLPIGLAIAGIHPFADLFKTYDPAWLAVVQEANPFVFPSEWFLPDWASVLFDATVAAWAARRLRRDRPPLGALCRAASVAGLAGIGAAWIGSDVLRDVLLTGLQLWRAHWLLHWTAVASVVPLMVDLWRTNGPNERAATLLLVAALLSLGTVGPLAFVPGAVAAVVWAHRYRVSPFLSRFLCALCAVLAAMSLARQAGALSSFATMMGGTWPVVVARPLSFTIVVVALVAAGLRFLPSRPALGAVIASALVVLSVAGWDQREAWTRYQEDYVEDRGLLWADEVRADDRVYWYQELGAPWLMMRHANYYSPNQSAGVLFNRETAIELNKRSNVVMALEFQETVCRVMNSLNEKASSCEPDLAAMKDICETADRLSFVVLRSALPVKPVSVFTTGFRESGLEKVFRLYRCTDLAHARVARAGEVNDGTTPSPR